MATLNPAAEKKSKRDSLQWIGAALGILFLLMLGYTQRDRFVPGINDFVQLYAGAQLSGTPRLYEPEASKEIHKRVLGVVIESVYYSRPPFYAFVLRPLGKLPYRAAYWTFQGLSALALIGFLWIWAPRCRELLLFASLCLPLLTNILTGQDLAFALLAAALSIEAMRRKLDFLAGVLLSFCAIKVHLFALVPVILMIHKRWRVIGGGIAGGSALLALSFLSDGLDWPRRYLALLSNPELHPGPEHMPTLRGLVYGLMGADSSWAIAVLSLAVVCLVMAAAWRKNLELGIAFALIGGLLIGYHAYLQDCVILLLAFVLVLEHSRSVPLRGAMAVAITPPLFLFLTAGRPWNAVVPIALLGLLVLGSLPAKRESGEAAILQAA